MLVVSAFLFVYILARARKARTRRRRPSPSARRCTCRRAHAGALNGFGLWVAMMIGLTVVNYGYPDRAARDAEGDVGAGDSDRGPLMHEPALYSWRNPWFRWSVVVARRADGRLRCWSASSGCPRSQRRLHRQGHLGRASAAPPACRATWSRRAARRRSAAPRPPRSCSTPAWRARAAATRSAAARRSALQCTHVPRRAGHERGQRAQPRRPVSRGHHQAAAGLQARRPRQRRSCRRSRRTCRTATSRDLAAYYASLPKARTAPTTLRRDRLRPRWCASATRCATSRRASRATAASTRSSARRGSRACRRSTWSTSSATSSGERRNDSHAQMRNMARPMSSNEIEQVADFYARRGQEAQNR